MKMQLLILLFTVVGALAANECPANSHFEECGTACPLTCDNYKNPPKFCVLMCNIGCQCDAGYVKAQDGSCVLPEHCPAQAESKKVCFGEPETGMCRGYFPMFYYDAQTGTCKQFVYGGCGGNGNRYNTEEECLQSCGSAQLRNFADDVCSLPIKEGLCKGYFKRYAFDVAKGKCREFIYGGCGGNKNNFRTLEACESTCSPVSEVCEQERETGPCRAAIPRFFFNKAEGKCELFSWSGCGGNDNNFKTIDECEDRCFGSYLSARSLTHELENQPK